MIVWALEEKLAHESADLKMHKDTAAKAPETFKALSKLFDFTIEDMEEEEVGIASYAYLLDVIKGVPTCKRTKPLSADTARAMSEVATDRLPWSGSRQ